MTVYLETPRLRLRRFTADDTDLLVELNSDPAVMEFLTGGKPTPRARIVDEILPEWLTEYDRWPHWGHFAAEPYAAEPNAAQPTEPGEFIGWFAMRPKGGYPDDVPELGYRLRRSAWGHGYATEGSLSLIDAAFDKFGATRIVAETMAVNTRSRGVMERCGMRHVGTRHEHWDHPIPGTQHGEVDYAITREEWLARKDTFLG